MDDPQTQQNQTAREIRESIMRMEKQEDRDILVLYKLEERSPKEVAGLLGISIESVYTRCNRAMGRLRDLLNKEGGCHV